MKHNIDKVIAALEKKRCSFQNNGLTNIIDISKAEKLGNKSWGKIEFLINYNNFVLIGRTSHKYEKTGEEEKKPFIMKECIMKTSILRCE